MIGALGDRWTTMLADAGADADGARELFRYVVHRYQEPWRRAHTLERVATMLDAVDDIRDELADPLAVQLAAWFTDAVFRPHTVGDDQYDSAALAREELARVGVPEACCAEVARLVLLTRTHEPAPDDADGIGLCDADRAVLGVGRWQYARYADGIRHELRHLTDVEFRRRRERELQQLVKRPLFAGAHLRDRLDAKARANIRWELARLAAGMVDSAVDLGGPLSRPEGG